MPPVNQSEELFAVISAAGSGDNTVVAATAARRIRVIGICLVAAGAVTARFESAAGGTALTGAMSLITGTPLVAYNPLGLFEQDVVTYVLID